MPSSLAHFSQEIENHQTTWDQTSIGIFKLCPYQYYLRIIKGYCSQFTSVHLLFGQYYHTALEAHERALAAGADKHEALCLAVEAAFYASWDAVHSRPWMSTEPTKTRETLIMGVVWYLSHYAKDTTKTLILSSGKPAVELSSYFSTSLKSSLTKEPYSLCNYFDRIVVQDNKIYILDYKTTKGMLTDDFAKNFSPDNQVSHYLISGEIVLNMRLAGLIIDAMQVGVNFCRFRRYEINRSQAQLAEWYSELDYWFRCAEACVKTDIWPKNDKSCGYYGSCPYRKVCAAQVSMRQRILATEYIIEKWEPLKLRG
jgi:hypothetical protein